MKDQTDVEWAEATLAAIDARQASDARDAKMFRRMAPLLAVMALLAGVAFVSSGFAIGFLLVTAMLLVGTFFAFMIGFMS